MRPRFAILLVAAVWLAHSRWSTSHEPTAEARPRAQPAPATTTTTRTVTTAYVPTTPRPALHLPAEPPRFVESAEALPEAGAQTIHGTLHDFDGELMIGATVVATSPALRGEQVVITDENGYYRITSLPPGTYVLTVYYNNQTFSEPDLEVGMRHATVAELALDVQPPSPPTGEVIAINGATKGITIDRNYTSCTVPVQGRTFGEVLGGAADTQGDPSGEVPRSDDPPIEIIDEGATHGVTIDDTYTKNIPTGRVFSAVLGVSAGTQVDSYGVPIQSITIDTNYIKNIPVPPGTFDATLDAASGSQSDPPGEFIEEIEIITGGTPSTFAPTR